MYPWVTIARLEVGQAEIPGPRHNPRILEYHRSTRLEASADEVPWCAAFVGWCLERARLPSTRSALAMSYACYGVPCEPRPGAIAVWDRGGGRGHVEIVERVDGDTEHRIGGNVRNQVAETSGPLGEADHYRFPILEAPP